MTKVPRLLITAGEPAGIGPDLVLKLTQEAINSTIVVVADADMLGKRAKQLGLSVALEPYTKQEDSELKAGKLYVWHVPLNVPASPGILEAQNASYVLKTLEIATHACMESAFDALVTGPVHKGIINDAGFVFTGHTEFLAEHSGCKNPVMMLATDELRVALATTHLPLCDVSKAITHELLEETLTVLHDELIRKFGIANPKITVCGLNPHAGEDGHLGREEIDVIKPVIARLINKGMILKGPVAADTAFTQALLKKTDAYLTMYHDQALPVLKYSGFGKAVNITLGLPFIRTSVDHGTAIDLAGTGNAKVDSLIAAIRLARNLCRHTH